MFLDLSLSQLTLDNQKVSFQTSNALCQNWATWMDFTSAVLPSCKIAAVEEVYNNYDIGEMLSYKKPQKTRMKAVEIHLTLTIGLFKIRNSKSKPLTPQETELFNKFFNQTIKLFHEDRWMVRKMCAEKLE